MSPELIKRQNGRFYTEGNPFVLPAFKVWAKKAELKNKTVLEPFAGANNIIRALQSLGYAKEFQSFDIDPQHPLVLKKNTLEEFPSGFDVCITNPPWLAKNSAHRRGLPFPETSHDDLYKHALEMCLAHCPYVAAIIPATFLQSGIFLNRTESVVFLHDKDMFSDTETPSCLALFVPQSSGVKIYHDTVFIGELSDLQTLLPKSRGKKQITFNHPQGELGFIAFDDTRSPSIRFCLGDELAEYPIGHSSRMITRIKINKQPSPQLIEKLNSDIDKFRNETFDVFLTPFKGLRKDGMYRRRMDYSLARTFIETYA